ncbi:MAG: hypothetical protein GU356_11940 [Pyrobaculum sp.]|jgi:hypothetical protein|nr:hypothetical protein [Pyrobaculum sp.]
MAVAFVEFWDESVWKKYFREELGAFYSALAGFLKARQEVLGRLSGDLAQVLMGGDRDLALQMLLGGVRQECVDRGVIKEDCFSEGSAARFFREKLGFEVSLDALNKLVNALKAGKMPQELGKITERETDVINTLKEVKRLLDEVYRRVPVEVAPKRYEVRDARDFVVAYEEVLNAGLRLLPLYNPFTLFLNSLRLTPKPYLRLMYGERLFDGGVAALMEKYGVKIGLRIAPGLGKELDEELGLFGHEKDTVGDLVARVIGKLYGIYGDDEFKTYLNKYAVYDVLESVGIYAKDVHYINVYVDSGVVRLSYDRVEKILSYFEFVERFCPIMFLGLTRPNSYGASICLSYVCL